MSTNNNDPSISSFMEEVSVPDTNTSAPEAPAVPVPAVEPPMTKVTRNATPDWLNDGLLIASPPAEAPKATANPAPVAESPTPVSTETTPIEIEEEEVPVTVPGLDHVLDEEGSAPPQTESDRMIQRIIGESLLNDASDGKTDDTEVRLVIPCQDSEEIGEALVKLGTEMGTENFRNAFQDDTSFPSYIRESLEHLTSNFKHLSESLRSVKKSVDANSENTKSLQDVLQRNVGNIGSTLTRGIPTQLSSNKRVAGDAAAIMMASMAQGLRRIPLWNSGIHLTIRAATMKELVMYYSSINTSGYDYGRELGAWYFLYADYTVKKTVLEQLLPAILTDCNYKHWKNTNKLLDVISLHDYDVILWAIAAMMYREGVDVHFTCVHPNCNHVEVIKSDLLKTRYVNTDKLTSEAITFMGDPETTRNDNDLKAYRASLKMDATFKLKIENAAADTVTWWELDFDTATCGRYIQYGGRFNGGLFNAIHKPSETEVREFITVNYYKAFLPWIREIRSVTEAGYLSEGPSADKDTIMIIDAQREDNRESMSIMMDMLQMENQEFEDAVLEYIRDTRITHIAHPYFTCTKCGKQPSVSVDGFIPYDVQMHFFQLCLMRMLRAKD